MALKEKTGWLFVFMTGFVIGVLLINFWTSSEYIQEGILNANTLERLKAFEIDSNKFFVYVLEERLKMILFMTLLATTLFGILASYLYIGWLGASLGVLLATMTLRFGMKGTFLFFTLTFPQYIFYIPAAILLVNWCVKLCSEIHFGTWKMDSKYNGKKQKIVKAIVQLGAIIAVVIIGSILESYVNPILLNKFVRFF